MYLSLCQSDFVYTCGDYWSNKYNKVLKKVLEIKEAANVDNFGNTMDSAFSVEGLNQREAKLNRAVADKAANAAANIWSPEEVKQAESSISDSIREFLLQKLSRSFSPRFVKNYDAECTSFNVYEVGINPSYQFCGQQLPLDFEMSFAGDELAYMRLGPLPLKQLCALKPVCSQYLSEKKGCPSVLTTGCPSPLFGAGAKPATVTLTWPVLIPVFSGSKAPTSPPSSQPSLHPSMLAAPSSAAQQLDGNPGQSPPGTNGHGGGGISVSDQASGGGGAGHGELYSMCF